MALACALQSSIGVCLGEADIMATNPQAITGSGRTFNTKRFSRLAAVIDIFRTLGGIVVLEATVKSHSDKIEQ